MQIKRRRPKYNPKQREVRTRINEWIKIPEVFLIDENGIAVGKISTDEARQRAQEVELDLVEINPKANPSICKIMDYGKIKYEKEKQAHKQKIAIKKNEIKGIRLSFKIKGNDLQTRVKQAEKFLLTGSQVRIEMLLKGREKAHSMQARQILGEFVKSVQENLEQEEIKTITPIQKLGGKFSTTIAKN